MVAKYPLSLECERSSVDICYTMLQIQVKSQTCITRQASKRVHTCTNPYNVFEPNCLCATYPRATNINAKLQLFRLTQCGKQQNGHYAQRRKTVIVYQAP